MRAKRAGAGDGGAEGSRAGSGASREGSRGRGGGGGGGSETREKTAPSRPRGVRQGCSLEQVEGRHGSLAVQRLNTAGRQ